MVEEYRAIKYCDLCSKNYASITAANSYRHQAMLACEQAAKTKEELRFKYGDDKTIAYFISKQIEGIKGSLELCTSCNGEAAIKNSLEDMLNKTLVLDRLILSKVIKKSS